MRCVRAICSAQGEPGCIYSRHSVSTSTARVIDHADYHLCRAYYCFCSYGAFCAKAKKNHEVKACPSLPLIRKCDKARRRWPQLGWRDGEWSLPYSSEPWTHKKGICSDLHNEKIPPWQPNWKHLVIWNTDAPCMIAAQKYPNSGQQTLKARAQHHSKPLATAILFLNSLAVRVVIPIILLTSHFQQESRESEQLFILDEVKIST